jgi:hypothetical protein
MAIRATPEAAIGFLLAVAAGLAARNLAASAGKEREWDSERIEKISSAIGLATFGAGFIVSWLAEAKIGSFLKYLVSLF